MAASAGTIAWASRHPDAVAIVVVNALLGWTIVGWLRAFTMLERGLPMASAGVVVRASQAGGSARTPR